MVNAGIKNAIGVVAAIAFVNGAAQGSLKGAEKNESELLTINRGTLEARSSKEFLRLNKIELDGSGKEVIRTESEVINIGLNNSPEIRSSLHLYNQAIQDLRSEYSSYYPELEFSGTTLGNSQTNTNLNYGGNGWGDSTKKELIKENNEKASNGVVNYLNGVLGGQVSIALIDFTRDFDIAASMDNAKYYKNLISYAIKQKLNTIRKAVVSYQSAKDRVTAYQESRDFAKSSYDQILKSYHGGYATLIDVNQYYALYNNYKADLVSAEAEMQTALSTVLAELSQPQSVNLQISSLLKEPGEWPLKKARSIELGKKNSENIQNYVLQSKIYRSQAASEIGQYLPKINGSVYASMTTEKGTSAIGYPSGTVYNYGDVFFGVTASWKLFDGFDAYNTAKGLRNKARSELNQAASETYLVEQEIASGILSLDADNKAYNLNSSAYKAQRKMTDLTLIGYKSGYNTVFDLAQAQQSAVSSLLSVIQNKENAAEAMVDLEMYTGSYRCRDPVNELACSLLKLFNPKDFVDLDAQ